MLELRGEFEFPQCVVPHLLEQPGRRAKGVTTRTIEPLPAVGARLHELRVLERLQLEGYGAEGDVGHRSRDVAGAHLVGPHQPKNLLPAGRRNSTQWMHGL